MKYMTEKHNDTKTVLSQMCPDSPEILSILISHVGLIDRRFCDGYRENNCHLSVQGD